MTHGSEFANKRLVSTRYDWKYTGKVHEVIDFAYPIQSEDTLAGTLPRSIYSKHETDMSRRYDRDAFLLESAVEENPLDARSIFYLGNTYNMLDRKEDAIIQWTKRVVIGGWEEEVYMSAIYAASVLDLYFRGKMGTSLRNSTWEAMLEAGLVNDKPRDPAGDVRVDKNDYMTAFKKAHEILPYRQEALYNIAKLSRTDFDDLNACTAYAEEAQAKGPYNELTLFADVNIYKYGVLDELCKCAYYIPAKFDRGEQACRELMSALEEAKAREGIQNDWISSMLVQTDYNLNAYRTKRIQALAKSVS